jgi:hypothetical protein
MIIMILRALSTGLRLLDHCVTEDTPFDASDMTGQIQPASTQTFRPPNIIATEINTALGR